MATEQPAEGGEAAPELLVSEFPPPPPYYKTCDLSKLEPPAIPQEALERGTRRAAAAAAKAREEAERMRLQQDMPNTDAILGGENAADEEEEGDVVAVFGEIVEDPYLYTPLDICEDPRAIRDSVLGRNREIVETFVGLVKDLVHNPAENKKRRDDLSHKVFEMLQECNKFREHQAREILIELLEKQLEKREEALESLQVQINKANELL
uniref:Mediator of RNA polymerase II transcription subunit 7 n=1 Tax=Grammatophora oceanica TaxID=210454 RepID=A0A7S1YMN3_9STRA|mmetsp:Transcript_6615/g.9680  ORF Transcript_6615/g.9680 Transcript_6615/m.9680 type:complete len:209 (+) Transcript_6615:217-843(+)|eukprot:CAMPEP_0194032536 /NCGR_PEP_ID=MMETSP0009_2-20130614/5451_1 /TAXON_ID=210454 /ORGANISM="Grammatophora oceanica, Strain CCMP 410" /LENGTH=208 /DNA_ID=CAMNT_0038673011 /DNA_START=217 /DNA_END=843 /DNA_ORIENTATION=-